MNTQTALPASASRRTFRERIDGLMDHVIAQLDMGTTARHEQQYLKTGNLLGAAGKLLDALQADTEASVIQGTTAVFMMEAGVWDQTPTLQRIAGEQGVTCKIELKGSHTSVDLTGAEPRDRGPLHQRSDQSSGQGTQGHGHLRVGLNGLLVALNSSVRPLKSVNKTGETYANCHCRPGNGRCV